MKIRTVFSREKVLQPHAYTMQKKTGDISNVQYPYEWSPRTIICIVQNKVYLGHMISNKSSKKSFKSKRAVMNDESEWIVIENTHEPLVDEYIFEQAQKIAEMKRRTWTGEPHIFAGLIRCADCGKAMHYLKRVDRTYTASYSCNTYSRYGKGFCTMHYIRYEDLYDGVLNDIRRYAEMAIKHEQDFMEMLNKAQSDKTKSQLVQHEKEISKAEKRLSEISVIIKRLYEDYVIGKITDERYDEMSKGYEAESADLKSKISDSQKVIGSYKDADRNTRQFTALMQKHSEIKELDAAILNELVNKIEVHEREVMEGERRHRIDIYYNFVGVLEEIHLLLYDRRWKA